MDITASRLVKTYREQDGPVIDDVAFTVPAGSFLALMGRSGSGKSTLLNLLAGIVQPTAGQVFYGETDLWQLSDAKRSHLRATMTATIFQSYNLFDFLSVQENIALGIRLAGRHADQGAISQALDQVGMGDCLRARPDELSGGQR
ncbi:ABC transporter ATP-binding protein [uncultured Corynebacterium sp.]|uniref:ABC transporter ATP-binding protein n=1 Tax=uncultured Corynebacterium sp. TaxID=159447 RepID=UPI0025F45593|nr:ATP-binding cassette domain-containing protein [uncultured Corynebacterium sp.]